MKKFISGLIVGALLMITTQSFAAGIGYTGKKISGEQDVKVNGNVIGRAIITENKSFIPVREIADSFGAAISFEKGGTISLTTNQAEQPISKNENIIDEIAKQKIVVDGLKQKIETTQEKVKQYEDLLNKVDDSMDKDRYKMNYEVFKKTLDDLQSDLVKQESKLRLLEDQVSK